MAKISPVAIKYMIYADLEAEGTLEKPDVIGAIFGQTEGLLGSELEMRELQKEGKIGRIEVQLKIENGKTFGKIQVPSALDKEETSLIAAAVETIERVGPSNAKIKIEKIEDVRGNKREYILERAKKLLGGMEEKMPNTRELARNIKIEARVGKLKEYGEDNLPAGNLNGEEIIVVEGRADVINLLKNGVENVIGMDGTKLPKTIKELSYNKEMTLFVDGDRGGKLIAKNVIDNARIDFIAFAPDGKEVEELTGKEIFSSLRKKIPVQEFSREKRGKKYFRKLEEKEEKSREVTNLESSKLKNLSEEIENSNSALLLNRELEVIDKVSVRGIFSSLNRKRGRVFAIVVDRATPAIIRLAEENSINTVMARNFSSTSNRLNLISL